MGRAAAGQTHSLRGYPPAGRDRAEGQAMNFEVYGPSSRCSAGDSYRFQCRKRWGAPEIHEKAMRYLVLLSLLWAVAAHAEDHLPNGDVIVQGYHCYSVYRKGKVIRDTCGIKAVLRQMSRKDRQIYNRLMEQYRKENR